MVSSMASRSPLPTAVHTVGGRRGLAVEPQVVCSNSSNHCTCADEVGHTQCQGAERGFPTQDSAGKGLCCPDSAAFPAESAGAASRWAHLLGWAPTPPWAQVTAQGAQS